MTNDAPMGKKKLDEMVDKMDYEVMEWFYECCRINFDVDGMVQDSTDLREIIRKNLESL